jgi:hypothetical protein
MAATQPYCDTATQFLCVGLVSQNGLFEPFVAYIYKRTFYQDRLGTNIGKALKKRTVLPQAKPSRSPALVRKHTHTYTHTHTHSRRKSCSCRVSRAPTQAPCVLSVFLHAGHWTSHVTVAATVTHVARKRHFLSHLYIKCIILPRQARDEHRKNSKKVPFSLSGWHGATIYTGRDRSIYQDRLGTPACLSRQARDGQEGAAESCCVECACALLYIA